MHIPSYSLILLFHQINIPMHLLTVLAAVDTVQGRLLPRFMIHVS